MNIDKGNILVIDAKTGQLMGAYEDRSIAIDAIADGQESGEWTGWYVLAEVTDDKDEVQEAVEEYQEQLDETN